MKNLLLKVLGLFLISSIASANVRPVDYVDLNRYTGRWYEIARYPNAFQKKCGPTIAEYGVIDGQTVSVKNTCYRTDKPNKVRIGKARAKVLNPGQNSVLKVSFVPVFYYLGWFVGGDYRILELDDNYEWALVGDKKREYLWILARNPVISDELYQSIVEKATLQGFDATKIIKSPVWNK